MPIRATLLLFLLTVAGAAAAQIVTVVPASPFVGTVVQFSVTRPLEAPVTIAQTGNAFRMDIGPGLPIDPPILTTSLFSVGQLPAGTYTFEVYNDVGTLRQRGTFAVELVPIPALSPRALAALAVMLVLAGWYAVTRKM